MLLRRPLSVETQGTALAGSVTSSAHAVLFPTPVARACASGYSPPCTAPGGIGPGPLIADEAHSTCTATESGVTGSATYVNGILETKYDANTQLPIVTEPIPSNPPPNYTRSGTIDHVGDRFRIVFNEQITGPDSITVNAAHMYLLGDVARGDMVVGSSTCSLSSTAANGAPSAADDSGYFTMPGVALTVPAPGLVGNDTDPDGNPLTATTAQAVFVPGPSHPAQSTGNTYVFPSDPAHGSVVINPDGSFTYTPDADFNGTDTFEYVVRDPRGAKDTGTVSIQVSGNRAPTAVDDRYSKLHAVPLNVPAPGVLGNDTDAEGDPLTAGSASDPAGGTVTLNADGSFGHTPDPGFTGTDTFTYVVTDSEGGTDTGLVTITPKLTIAAPVAADDAYGTNEDTPLNVAAPGVRANDTDADNDTLLAGSAGDPPNGTVTLAANGSLTYTPDANFSGTDTFTYVVSDGSGGTDTGQVTVTVAAVNDASVAADDSYGTNEDTPLTVDTPGVLANDTDVEGGALSAGSASAPSFGTVILAPDGSFTYTPDADFFGVDTFSYVVSDSSGGTDEALVIIGIDMVNDPPVADDDTYSTAAGSALTVDTPGVLANDTDVDGDSLAAGSASDPAHGSVTLALDGSFIYTPDAGFTGTDTFTYEAGDGNGGTDAALVTITVDAASGPTVSIGDVSVHEGDAGTAKAVFTVSLAEPSASTVTVDYATADSGATAGEDYTAKSGTLTFAPGMAAAKVKVPIAGDVADEADEAFTVTLANAIGATVGDGTGTGAIVDDDPKTVSGRRLAIGDVSVHEGDAGARSAVMTVTLSKASTSYVTVNFATANARPSRPRTTPRPSAPCASPPG